MNYLNYLEGGWGVMILTNKPPTPTVHWLTKQNSLEPHPQILV